MLGTKIMMGRMEKIITFKVVNELEEDGSLKNLARNRKKSDWSKVFRVNNFIFFVECNLFWKTPLERD